MMKEEMTKGNKAVGHDERGNRRGKGRGQGGKMNMYRRRKGN